MHSSTRLAFLLSATVAVLSLAGCGDQASLPVSAGTGPNPTLPAPKSSLIPTVNIADAIGWPQGAQPVAAQGLSLTPFATGLDHPRWMLALPNGDVLVAETNAPPKPEDGKGIKGWVMGLVMGKAGAKTPSANRITLLRDSDGDGKADIREPFLEGLNSPFGMALVGGDLYIADTDAVVKVPYKQGDTRITAKPAKVVDLPGGPINHHWTKNIIASRDGSKLYATVGSNSNVGENGMEAEQGRAAIWEIDLKTGAHRIFASGLRNPNGMDWEPTTGALWTAVNERDEIGSDLVPDYMTSVKDGGFYGWPYSYYGQHIDQRVEPQRPDLVAKAIPPDYALGPHTASLGLTFSRQGALPQTLQQGAFVGQHGSWNREPASGYKVIFVPFQNGKPSGEPVDVLTGFLDKDGKAQGRPVGVTLDGKGALLVADDVGNAIWRVGVGSTAQSAERPDQPKQ
ncbi:sorbosone dehydrogenase family protein [Azospirillum sp. YIM B02556]|uniref:Sorbosone dehydrogenase family protein n=1 Tax=Azospirillum endophyticum TaxID=2800326 RepID=A0ABS1FGL2_9PROT|nr:sorbosone dehydrogenase family protein [Azospirillum endophyticum]MBK1842574.1 sorbosone dehydrogenase family protein [Azospirillum endophyticum]